MGCWSNSHAIGQKENIQFSIEEGLIKFESQKYNINDLPMHGSHNLNNAVMAMYAAFFMAFIHRESFSALKESKGSQKKV